VRVEAVNPGSQACVGNPGDLVVTARVALLVLVVGVAVIALVYQLLRLNSAADEEGGGRRMPRALAQIGLTAVLAGIGIAVGDRIAGQGVVFEVRGFQSTYLAFFLGIPLVLIAAFIVTARDARRFVAGTMFAIVGAFLILYPNISALPLPSTVVNAYQGLLPTYLYPFQFPVNTDPAAPGLKLFALEPALLLLALTITCLVVGYAAWVWRIGPIEPPRADDGGLPAGGEA
jgi:cytochrome bd-type quinol oxidase subunit 2